MQRTQTSIDLTFGVGVRLPTVDLNGDGCADVILGIYCEFSFRQGSSVTAISPSGSGLTYTRSVDSRTNAAALTLRLWVPLGGGPLFRVRLTALAHFSDQRCQRQERPQRLLA